MLFVIYYYFGVMGVCDESEKRIIDMIKKPIATTIAVIFAGLSLIISLGALWHGLVGTLKWPLWKSQWFFVPGWSYNLYCVVLAILSIIVALCVKERRKRILLTAILMLIPGILYAVCYLLFAWGMGIMG